ncbi:unnamed protein product [Peronospora belbahrii]|uniref:DNA mismatch repair proteins mutS family domain-containing protein n=1 Tax=Peronospora belbahrii TaxID=622444 RepID=A0AAU9KPZ7_9STRA|nr:unnamed protein product [Peronospora belbahrii]
MEDTAAPRVELNEATVRPPRYGVPTHDGAVIFAGRSASLCLPSSRGGSGSLSSDMDSKSSFLIAAVAENRAREIGICAIDLVSPYELLLWTVIDSHSYVDAMSLLQAYQPVEILVVESSKSCKINDEISKRFAGSNCRIVPLARNQTKGAEDIKRVMANNVDINIGRNYVAMASVACLMKYVEYIQGIYIAEKTLKPIDTQTAHGPSNGFCFGAGARHSRKERQPVAVQDAEQHANHGWKSTVKIYDAATNLPPEDDVLHSVCHVSLFIRITLTIRCSSQARHDVVGIFLDNPAWFFDVMEALRDFVDLDRLLGQLVFVPKVITPRVSRIAIGSVIALKHTLECLPKLVSCLESTSAKLDSPCPLLNSIIQSLRDEQFTEIKADIERVVNDRVKVCRLAAQKRIQECFAVRAGVDGMLDVARRTYLDTIEKIHEVIHTYKENLGIPIRLSYTSRRGYHLAVPANTKDLPASFIERVTMKTVICCSTRPLASLNARLNEALTAVYKLSNDVIQQLLDKIRPRSSTMHAMVESIALLDMLLSFVNVVALSPPEHPYTKPTVTEHGNLIIKKGRHPLVERVLKDQAYIPSDTFFDPLSTFHTSDAVIPIRDRICTRFGTSDDMEENASSFAVEMTETAFILESCTARSLVLIDELGRGTANNEGTAIAWSIGEELIHRRSYTCFATHYHQLNRLSHLYPRCRCYHVGTESNTNSVHFRYVLKDGPFPLIGMYGIKTAALSGLPTELIREAESIFEKLYSKREATEKSAAEGPTTNDTSRINKNLLHHLYALRYADLDYAGLRRQLQHLKNRFLAPAE